MSMDTNTDTDSVDTDEGDGSSLGPVPDGIPTVLRDREAWVCWHVGCRNCHGTVEYGVETCPECGEGTSKIPDDPTTGRYASSTNPTTWTDFETALAYYERDDTDTEGIGFVFSEDDPFVGVDLDNCRDSDTGDLDPLAADAIERCGSYAAVSSSGTGIHILAVGEVPDGGNRSGNVEMYDDARYFALTGIHIDGTPEGPQAVQDTIDALHIDHIADNPAEAEDDQVVLGDVGRDGRDDVNLADAGVESLGYPGSDDELIRAAKRAGNGAKFKRLWSGDTTWYDSHSEARQALANLLAFWTGGDKHQMLDLFRQSDLYRDADDLRTFENYEIPTALENRGVGDFYDPNRDSDTQDALATDEGGDVDTGWAGVRTLYRDAAGRGPPPKGRARDAAYKLLAEQVHFATPRDSEILHRYNPETGIYSPDGELYVDSILGKCLGEHYSTHEKNELAARLKSQSYIDRDEFGGSWENPVVCIANGILNIESGELFDHSPEQRFVRRIDTPWPTPEGDGPDSPEEALAEREAFPSLATDVLGENQHDQDALYEFIGLAVHPGYIRDKALILHGEGQNGKTTLLKSVATFLGHEHTTSHSLGKLTDGKYAKADLYDSVANISAETPRGSVKRSETFKALTGGDEIEARHPYEKHFAFENEAVLMFAANELPDFEEDTDALHRRLKIISCTNTFGGDRRRERIIREATTRTERMGLLVRAVAAARRLREGEGALDATDAATARRAYATASNPIAAFAEAALDADGGWETNDDLYHAYVRFCDEADLPQKAKAVMLRKLPEAVEDALDTTIQNTRRSVDGSGGRVRGKGGVSLSAQGRTMLAEFERDHQDRLN